MNLLYNAFNGNEFNKIMTFTYETISQVNESKIYILTHEYEMFKMHDDESISIMYTRFTNIMNSLTALEGKDLKKLEVNDLIGSIITHEYTLKRGEKEGTPKKTLTLEAVYHESESDERNDDSSSSDSETSNKESTNLCLMAKDDIEVTNLDNIKYLSYEEL
ncbi:hypothetical protein I3760_11G110400 [Carya illinoinensis]|nr:hypothetical protein I3760_11G110400 [Carya illinoinensis]